MEILIPAGMRQGDQLLINQYSISEGSSFHLYDMKNDYSTIAFIASMKTARQSISVRKLCAWIMFMGCLILSRDIAAQQRLYGRIIDKISGDYLPGVVMKIVGTDEGATTNYDGEFDFQSAHPYPIIVSIINASYDTQTVVIQNDHYTRVMLELRVGLHEAFVQGNMEREANKKSSNPRSEMSMPAIRNNPAPTLFEGMGHRKDIDIVRSSLAMGTINTRGFNSTSPVRMLQIIDGVDNQSPGLNFSLGNFLGAAELDLQRMEVIVGASSPFYGPNAFNGVISMETRNPFYHQGLEVMMRTGERNLWEGGLRYARSFKNSDSLDVLAFKLNLYALTAHDWEARNYDPVADSQVLIENPGGYDGVHVYGDDYNPRMDKTLESDNSRYFVDGGVENYYRTGYREEDLVDYNTRNYKANLFFHLRLQPHKQDTSAELILGSSFGSGTAIYQGDNRFSLRNILFFQHRLEWRNKDHFFVRAYFTHEDAGQTYDPYFTALRLQNKAKSDDQWAADYSAYWRTNILPIMRGMGYPVPCTTCPDPIFPVDSAKAWLVAHPDELNQWHIETENAANKSKVGTPTVDRLIPGTESFQQAFDDITSRLNNESGGTRFYDRSALFHLQGEYIFRPRILSELRVGGNFRQYRPDSKGTIFYDTAGTHIRNTEFGVYTGVKKEFFEKKKLTAAATIRLDKNQNYKVVPTYAASVVFEPWKDAYWSFAASSALRNPTLTDQYLYLNVGPAILAGQTKGVDSLVTIESLRMALEMQNKSKLVYFNVNPLRPEYVTTLETILRIKMGSRLHAELNYYRNTYKDFIGYLIGLKVKFDPEAIFVIPEYLQAYRYSANSSHRVHTEGAGIGWEYAFNDHLTFDGNYSFNRLKKSTEDDPIIPAYNTPKHKFNLGVSGNDLKIGKMGFFQHTGFALHYKWVDAYTFEGSPQFTGPIKAYGIVDAQVNVKVAGEKMMIKAGASNVLNHHHYETYGGPSIGRMGYIQINYSF